MLQHFPKMKQEPKLELNSSLIKKIAEENYQLKTYDSEKYSKRTNILKCEQGKCYLLKESKLQNDNKFLYLYSLGVTNVLYPELNLENKFLTHYKNQEYYLMPFYDSQVIFPEKRAVDLLQELNNLHNNTMYPRQLSPNNSRYKFDELSKQLDYKFKIIEEYIRNLESRKINEVSNSILMKYYRILDAKNELIRLQKRIILYIKDHESVDYVFVHNNPKLEHLLYIKGTKYLVSLDNGKSGISSLDFSKFYVENENLNLDVRKLVLEHLQKQTSDFYYDYFRYLVLLIYIKRINLNSNILYVSKQFEQAFASIDKYFINFEDKKEEKENFEELL